MLICKSLCTLSVHISVCETSPLFQIIFSWILLQTVLHINVSVYIFDRNFWKLVVILTLWLGCTTDLIYDTRYHNQFLLMKVQFHKKSLLHTVHSKSFTETKPLSTFLNTNFFILENNCITGTYNFQNRNQLPFRISDIK